LYCLLQITYIFFADRESSAAATVVSDTPDSGEVEEVIADYESIYADEGEGEQEGGEEEVKEREEEGEKEGEKEGEQEEGEGAVLENEEDEEDVSMNVLEKLLLDDDEQSKDDDSRAEEETEKGESSLNEKGMAVEQQQQHQQQPLQEEQQQPLQKEQQQHQEQQELLQQQQEQQQQQHQQEQQQQQLEQEQQLLQKQQVEQQQVEQQQQLEQQQQQHNVEKREVAEQEVTPPVRLNPRHHLRQAPDSAPALADPSGNTADKATASERTQAAQGIPVEKSNMNGKPLTESMDVDSDATDSAASLKESPVAESVGTGTAQSEPSKATQTELPDISRTDAADNGQNDIAQTDAGNMEQTEPADATQAVIAETPGAESVEVVETEIDNSSETEPAEAEHVELVTETESADETATTVEPPTDVSHSVSIESENTEKAGSVEMEVVNGEIVQNVLEDNVQNVLESVGEDEKMDKQPSYHKELKGQGETHLDAPLENAKTEGLKTNVEASSNGEELSTNDPSLSESVQEETSTTEAPLVEKSTGFLGSLFGGFSSDPPAPTNNDEQMDPLTEERTFAEGAWSLCCWCCGLRCFFRHPACLWVHANTT
jgi:hypothetical protein